MVSSPKPSYQLLAASCNNSAIKCNLSVSLLPRYTAYFSKRRSHAPASSQCVPQNGDGAKFESFPPLTMTVVVPGDPLNANDDVFVVVTCVVVVVVCGCVSARASSSGGGVCNRVVAG